MYPAKWPPPGVTTNSAPGTSATMNSLCDRGTIRSASPCQNFTGTPGKYVSLKDSIKGFRMIVNGECDSLPEQAFYMVGTIEEAFEKAKTLQ